MAKDLIPKFEQALTDSIPVFEEAVSKVGSMTGRGCGGSGTVGTHGIKGNTRLGRQLKKWCDTTQKCYMSYGHYGGFSLYEPRTRSWQAQQCVVPRMKQHDEFFASLVRQEVTLPDGMETRPLVR